MASDQADTVTSDSGYYESVENAQMDVDENAVGKWTTAARKRFYAEHSGSQKQQHHQALKVFIDGQETLIGAGGHVNWKRECTKINTVSRGNLPQNSCKPLGR